VEEALEHSAQEEITASESADSPSPDAALAAGVARGDPQACEQMVRRHLPAMLATARRILGDAAAAEDCAQEAFIKAFRAIDGFEQRSALSTWLHRIVVNEALSRLRRTRSAREDSIEALLPRYNENGFRVEPMWQTEVDPDETIDRDRLTIIVRSKIAELPDGYRIVLTLRDIEGLSTAEVAAAMGLTEMNVKTRLHRARAALKTLLEPLLKGEAA
jgi:RNA polymerase sigma-70 factor (ECF subfamily)